MNLYTECFWDDWDRIVDIYSERVTVLPEYINDDATYKIIILEKGVLQLKNGNDTCEVKGPALSMLSETDNPEYKIMQAIKADILFFKPSVIRDEFSFDRLSSGEFESTMGTSIYQDYILIKYFSEIKNIERHIIPLPLNGLKRIKELFSSVEMELKCQKDGYWPCRSRSYMIELLYYIIYSYIEVSPDSIDNVEMSEHEEFSKIVEYLNEHIEEHLTLDTLTKEFSINRNKLNELFMKQASMTSLNYLLNLRIDLAKLLLTKTEIPINEISSRVGYPDSNYFTKVFNKNVGMTPSEYRKICTP